MYMHKYLVSKSHTHTWTLGKQLEKKISAFEIRRKGGELEPLLDTVNRRQLQWLGHMTGRPGTLAHTVMHGGVEGR